MENNELIKIKSICIELMKNIKDRIKKNYSSENPIINMGIGILYFIGNTFTTIKRVYGDKEFHYIFYMKVFKSKCIHQTKSNTFMNRYPKIFSDCSDYFKDTKNIKILSYGCSTGEEVLTLREYFPSATIVGVEINKHNLKICKKLPVDDKINFIYSTPSEIKKHGKFDAIFCMAVLQRTPGIVTKQRLTSLEKIYPFEKFEQQIVELNDYVNKDGLMITHFTQYSFLDTIVSSKYKPLGECNQNNYRASVFDKNSNLIKNPASRKSIFIKLQN